MYKEGKLLELQIQLFLGDAIEEINNLVRKGIKVDLILTDPPYGTTKCSWDAVIPIPEMWQALKSIRKENTPIVLFGTEPFSSKLRLSNPTEYKYDWVWDKGFGRGHLVAKYRPMQQTENIMVFGEGRINYYPIKVKRDKPLFSKEGSRTDVMGGTQSNNYKGQLIDDKHPTNLLSFPPVPSSQCYHPTQKPVNLMKYLIRTYTQEGDLVLDFTMGSGTTGVSCKRQNRNFIGIDSSQKYYEIAESRIKNTMDKFF